MPCDPSTALLHYDLQSLWKHSATLTLLLGPEEKERGEEDEDEEAAGESKQDREILRTERKRRKSSMREVGLREVTFWRWIILGVNFVSNVLILGHAKI